MPDDRITSVLGNWLELSGAFQPSPVADADCDPEHDSTLTVASVHLAERTEPGIPMTRDLPRKTITALLPAAIPRLAARPSA